MCFCDQINARASENNRFPLMEAMLKMRDKMRRGAITAKAQQMFDIRAMLLWRDKRVGLGPNQWVQLLESVCGQTFTYRAKGCAMGRGYLNCAWRMVQDQGHIRQEAVHRLLGGKCSKISSTASAKNFTSSSWITSGR